MVQIYKSGQHNETLDIQNGKLGVKLDNSGNVQFTTTGNGLKGDVNIPSQVKAVKGITVEGNQLVLTNTEDATEQRVDLPAVPVDVKLQGAELTPENRLKLTLSDSSIIEVELASLIPPPKTAEQLWTEIKALPSFKADLLAVLKGESVSGLDNIVVGYLLPEA